MSLYESLTRVLAPFAERLNGLLTGYNGTTYSTPGEAVRSQISDLHVLIGDEPGTAIAGSAVSYDGTESGMTATNMQGAVDELSGDISNTNERLDQYEDVFTGDVDESVQNWLDEHPEATTTVQDGSITKSKLTDDLYKEISNPKFISPADLENVSAGIYTLGTVTLNEPIQMQRQNNRGVVIVDTVFNINTDVLFPAFNPSSYFILPSFIGCVFNNASNGRVIITSGSTDTVASRITGCNFINVDMVAETGYVQDFNFTNCYIQSYDTFLECNASTVQARFVSCTVETEGNKLVDAWKFVGYFSGTYEGNHDKDFYFVNCKYGVVELNSCWFESCKMLHVIGGELVNQRTVININNCEISGEQSADKFALKVDNPTYVSLFINGSHFVPYNGNSRFTDSSPDSFEQIKGAFILTSADSYCNPIGGIFAQDKAYATLEHVDSLKPLHYKLQFSQTVIDSGGITYDFPVGQYLLIIGNGQYSVMNKTMLCMLGASTEASTTAIYSKLVDAPSGTTLSYLSVTPTKQNATDKTFSVNFTASQPQTYFAVLIKLY